jgi:sigma-E factor negative regulatory protein RseC
MLIETGRVVAVEQEAVWVETIRQSTCGSCAANKGCGHGLLNRMADGRTGYVRVLPGSVSPGRCAIDDQVRIGIPEQVILQGSIVVYMLPLLLMLAGAATVSGLWSGPAEPAAVGGAVAGLLLGFALVYWHARRHRDDPALQPVLLEILSRAALPVRRA